MARSSSIRRELLTWLLAGLALAIAAATVVTYLRARDEANVLFDVQLAQTAASITGMPYAAPIGEGPSAEGLVVQVWDRNGVRVYLPRPRSETAANAPPKQQSPGFATIDTPNGPWRVYSVITEGQLVQVAQPLAVRRAMAASLALSTIMPLIVALPLVALFVWATIARGLAPFTRIASALGRRTPTQLAPLLATGWPREIQPVVGALNGLLGRLDAAIDAQRAFVADAAHELRTPLTALHLQAQIAERAGSEDERRSALADLRAGLARTTRMVEQLLALAREEPGVAERPMMTVDLAALARDVVAELEPIAAAKGVDLGLTDAHDATIVGDAASLRTLLANLVDNAIRYTPSGRRVDVAVRSDDGAITLAVRDNGPGIDASERERVFTRFARGSGASAEGSGLGLAIVRRIVERHGATIALGEGLDGRGLGVVVRFAIAAGAFDVPQVGRMPAVGRSPEAAAEASPPTRPNAPVAP
jgi:two-component system OmpR family sensor kinase